ncbi:MAG: hypothetical protein FWE34_08320 [Defluviitaleaceae bacterium]|nr:hypothetical protein [Defluviitaleaceae bacterium]
MMKKVLLVSPQAAATKLLLERTRQLAESQGIAVDISTMSEAECHEHINNFDLVLLSPHLRFLMSNKQMLSIKDDLPVEVLDSRDFGGLNAEALLQTIVVYL